MTGFQEKVLKIVSKIPKGKVLTYKKVAELAGRSFAWRAVGNILKKNYNPQVPCHRVVRSNGTPGGYNRGLAQKVHLLKQENKKTKKTAQEIQDEIFQKMPAEKKVRLALDFSLFCLKLQDTPQHGNRNTSHRY